MKTQNKVDFSNIEWSKIDREKAEFIYNEAIARLDSIHKNNDGITNKALGMLSFSLPILTALVGFFILQYGILSTPYQAISICSIIFLSVILVLLLFILIPKEISTAQGGPSAYFSDGYYLGSMTDIFKGNIQTVQQCIYEDSTVQRKRAILFKAAVLLYAFFPIVIIVVWIVASLFTSCRF